MCGTLKIMKSASSACAYTESVPMVVAHRQLVSVAAQYRSKITYCDVVQLRHRHTATVHKPNWHWSHSEWLSEDLFA